MKYPRGWNERKRPSGSVHHSELVDTNDKHVRWRPILAPDANRELEIALCALAVAVAQFVPFPDDLLALGFRNRPLSEEAWLRMEFALRVALDALEDLRCG